jgi:glycosyltransferase involved in cell wall biosynthesis
MDKLLSIIIPVYNVEPYLRECLDSVFAQDLTDCEVIAVNDGSTDGSPLILDDYETRYPGMLRVVSKENGGLSSARNAGVNVAQGRFLYFVDSDDYLRPHAITTIKQIIHSNHDVNVFYLDCIVTLNGKRISFSWECMGPVPLREFFNYAYEHKMEIAPNAVSYVYSSSYWRDSGLHFEDGIKYEDALFKYQLYVREDGFIKAVHVEEPFYVYRVGREGSISTNLTLKSFTDRQFVRRKIAQLLV